MGAENIVITKEKKAAVSRKLLPKSEYSQSFRKISDKLTGLAVPFIIFFLWEISTSLKLISPLFLPSPKTVVLAFYDMAVNQHLIADFRESIITVIQGFLFGTVFGLLFGITAGLSKTVEKLLGATLNSLRQIPALAWFPLIVLWIGAGSVAKTVVIAKTVFFPVFLNTLQGIRGVPKEYIEVARVFEYGKLQLLRKVILPAALPTIFVGIRFGAGLSWAMIIAAEMLSGSFGLGYLLTRSQELLLTNQLFVVIIIIGTVGYLIDVGLKNIEKGLLKWKKGFEG